MMNITPTVKQLLIINIIFFIGTQLIKNEVAYHYLSLYFFENPQFYAWQPLTHMFMHRGFMHIFFNMFALYSFGSALEHFWGGKKFLFFYISCGLGAALLHTGVNYYFFHTGLTELINAGFSRDSILELLNKDMINQQWGQVLGQSGLENFARSYVTPAVGASGAIYGLLVAFAFMFPNAELMMLFLPIPIKAKYFVPVILLMDLFSGVTGISIFGGGNIAHFAHIGGAVVGFFMMWYWKKNQFHNNRWN
ncbi:rhomboid family intramembrane serine protease [Flavobacterium lindanitolerans]|uniref:Membrane associated rhomboid family serine protease n=1 Tax=Flavobacterium lindanitolerans TaxID=428988 RepID=A0A497V7D7_9FLAO|nr:rhomboid family intramembrane serine protease [Flavobacterium lindanitolerans]MBC8645296.1 rhomboid family intramembrane serine protease [Flavobacterium lindanitolerans]PKW29705.1 membrane associated rhomboid family serine protease [Flavobacterium lindanitolerans]RLJ34794.1 membrane associated rhomboid family serine protease [Flavobacterium lindanitolerans]